MAVEKMKRSTTEAVWKSKANKYVIVALNEVSDPGNVGTIIRTCDWFGVLAVVLDRNLGELYNPKIVRSTMGSMFHLPVFDEMELPEVIRQAKSTSYSVYAAALKGASLRSGTINDKALIVFGNQGRGGTPG